MKEEKKKLALLLATNAIAVYEGINMIEKRSKKAKRS
jgi:hypothetical protein